MPNRKRKKKLPKTINACTSMSINFFFLHLNGPQCGNQWNDFWWAKKTTTTTTHPKMKQSKKKNNNENYKWSISYELVTKPFKLSLDRQKKKQPLNVIVIDRMIGRWKVRAPPLINSILSWIFTVETTIISAQFSIPFSIQVFVVFVFFVVSHFCLKFPFSFFFVVSMKFVGPAITKSMQLNQHNKEKKPNKKHNKIRENAHHDKSKPTAMSKLLLHNITLTK